MKKQLWILGLIAGLGLLAGCAEDKDTDTLAPPPEGPSTVAPLLRAAKAINAVQISPAETRTDAGRPLVNETDTNPWSGCWDWHFNQSVDELIQSKGWPMKVIGRKAEKKWKTDLTMLSIQEIGRRGKVYVIPFSTDESVKDWILPFKDLSVGDRVVFDERGWPHRVTAVWVRGSKYGYKPISSPLYECEKRGGIAIIPLD